MTIFIFLILYIVLTILAIYSKLKNRNLYIYTKALPIFLLLFMVAISVIYTKNNAFQLWLLIGLIFGVMGDILLLRKDWFVFGGISFLIGHLFYTIAFFCLPISIPFVPIIIIIVICISYALFLIKNLDKDKRKRYLPIVISYISIISIMFLSSLSFNLQYKKVEGSWLVLGAGLFMLSDGALSYGKFVKSSVPQEFLVSLTYYTAQFLIIFAGLQIKI